MTIVGAFLVVCAQFANVGCSSHRQLARLSTSFPATQPSDFYDQPAVAEVTGSGFDKLWAAAEQSARDFGFSIDR